MDDEKLKELFSKYGKKHQLTVGNLGINQFLFLLFFKWLIRLF